jgi:hypothetical protein
MLFAVTAILVKAAIARLRDWCLGKTLNPKHCKTLRAGANSGCLSIPFDDLIDMASSAARHGEDEDLLRLSPAYTSFTVLGV